MSSNLRYKSVKPVTLMLCATIFVSSLTACSQTPKNSNFVSKNEIISTQSYEDFSKNLTSTNNIKSIDKVHATFSNTRWAGVEYIKIDEESLLEIIKIAMNDAKNMYQQIGATNMTIQSDGSTSKNNDEFFPYWMNEYFFLARAKRESGNYMIDYIGEPVDAKGNRAVGIMCIVPEYIIPTLNQYMSDTFKCDIRFDNRNLVPNENDLSNFKTSNQSYNNLKNCVYDMVFTSICYDIYNAKCLGPNHVDYYEKFGGFDESLRQQVVTALYLFKRNEVILSLKDGSFYSKFGNTSYVQDILNYQNQFENKYSNTNQLGN